jgi:hypothetical protein
VAESTDETARAPAQALVALGIVIAVMLAALALATWGLSAPAARGIDAPPDVFSAARAREHLIAVFGAEPVPHPSGSAENAAVRERLIARLRQLGYAPETQRGVRCNGWGLCTEVVNVLAVHDGDGDRALLLAAHYDSVLAGPGVGDDAAGVAALLEVARLVAANRSHNDVVFLFTDGEELGLLGAELFVEQSPLAQRIDLAINLEARGTSGPSMMFETAGPSAALADVLGALERPVTSSLFSTVYRRLPNDTDFSVFARAGLAGFNFAFIGGYERYHTPEDDLAHLSLESLQHHGDGVWGLTSELMESDLGLADRPTGDAVYFDVMGRALIRWPVSWSLPLALLAMALVTAQIALGFRREADFFPRFVRMSGAALATMLIAGAIAYGLFALLERRVAAVVPHHPRPGIAAAAVALAVLATGVALALWLVRRAAPEAPLASRASVCAGWSAWALFGLVVAQRLPEACYLLVAPTLVAGVAGLVGPRFAGLRGLAIVALPIFAAALLWAAVAVALLHAVGLVAVLAAGPISALVVVIAFPGLVPLRALARRRVVPYGIAVGAVALALVAFLWPSFGVDRPQHQSLAYYRGPAGAEWWVDATWGEPPEPLAKAGSLGETSSTPLPLVGLVRAAVGPAPEIALPGPTLESASRSGGTIDLRLRSRGGWLTVLLLPPDLSLARVTMSGVEVPRYTLASPVFPGFRVIAFAGSAGAIPIAIESDRGGHALLLDVTPGLPAEAAPLVTARGEKGIPWNYGDLTIVGTRAELP